MARFSGEVGYGVPVEVSNGVWEDTIVERTYFGDVLRNTVRFQETAQKVNVDLAVTNHISVVADDELNENFSAIRYVRWAGRLWTVNSVEVQPPRLLLWLGGVYNGPTAAPVTP